MACWCCERQGNHTLVKIAGVGRSICDDCRLQSDSEIDFAGSINELFRCVTWEGLIPGKKRRQLQALLKHENPRIATLARELQREDELLREINAAKRLREYERQDELETQYAEWLDERDERLEPELVELLED